MPDSPSTPYLIVAIAAACTPASEAPELDDDALARVRAECGAYLDCLRGNDIAYVDEEAREFGPDGRCEKLGHGALAGCASRCHRLHDALARDVGDAECLEADVDSFEYTEPIAFSTSAAMETCVPQCVADSDPSTATLDPACDVVLEEPRDAAGGGSSIVRSRIIPPCGIVDIERAIGICWEALTTRQEMSQACVDGGWNLGIAVQFEAMPAGPYTLAAHCEPSQQRGVDCPDLP